MANSWVLYKSTESHCKHKVMTYATQEQLLIYDLEPSFYGYGYRYVLFYKKMDLDNKYEEIKSLVEEITGTYSGAFVFIFDPKLAI